MTKWFVVYSLETYLQHSDKIIKPLKPKFPILKYSKFTEIKDGDIIVYYGSGLLMGIFVVKGAMQKGKKDDPFWENFEAYNIEKINPMLDLGYFNFKKFYKVAFTPNKNFDPSVIAEKSSEGEAIIELEDSDFEKIEQGIRCSAYVKTINLSEGSINPTGYVANQEMVSGLLDYYNSRSTSFASLAVASVFGLVTLASIIQNTFDRTLVLSSDIAPLVISFIVFLGFASACLYTIQTYFHYAVISDKIKRHALERPYISELTKIRWKDYDRDNKFNETNLFETIADLGKQHEKLRFLTKKKYVLLFLFSLISVLLLLFIYWSVVSQLIIPAITKLFNS